MIRFLASGDTALVVEFGATVDRALNAQVLALAERIAAAGLPGVVEAVPTLRSLMVHYDPLRTTHGELKQAISPLLEGLGRVQQQPGRLWIMPTCYDLRHALDLEDVARRSGLDPVRVVELFSTTVFHVYSLGFLPGHPYLGEAPRELVLPRRDSPRVKVPMGSVATAVGMAVIYPLETPGGWHILGRTPVRAYDRRRDPPVFFAPNDCIRFAAIGLEEHDELEARAAAGEHGIVPEAEPVTRADEHGVAETVTA